MNIEWIDVQKWRRKKLEKLIEYLIIKTKQERWACVSSGVNFINVLWAAFAPVDPKSVKRYWQLDWTLTLLGATCTKAAHKFVGEINPRRQFHQHFLLAAFAQIFFQQKITKPNCNLRKAAKKTFYEWKRHS